MKCAFFERFEIELPDEAVSDCYHQGACDEDVKYWQKKIDLSHIPDDKLIAELKEHGAWDQDELSDRKANEQRIIWLAAGQIKDEEVS